jgi:hypothetical protein
MLGIRMRAPWTLASVSLGRSNVQQHLALWCLLNSNWEGRLTAMRWLIMFLGISGNASTQTQGVPKWTELHKDGKDSRIDMFDGGELFPIPSRDADALALIWKGCSKATSHPTEGSNHPDVTEGPLGDALHIVIDHLQKTIYAEKKRSLYDDTISLNALGAPMDSHPV